MASESEPAPSGVSDNVPQVTNAPPKFSRYRSVRKAAQTKKHDNHNISPASSGAEQTKTRNGPLQGSRSRYRRPGATETATSVPLPPLPITANTPHRPQTHSNGTTGTNANRNPFVDDAYTSSDYDEPSSVDKRHVKPVKKIPFQSRQATSNQYTTSSGDYQTQSSPINVASAQKEEMGSFKLNGHTRKPGLNIDVNRANVGCDEQLSSPSSLFSPNCNAEASASRDAGAMEEPEFQTHRRATARFNGHENAARSAKGSGFLSRLKEASSSATLGRGRKDTLKKMISSPVPVDQNRLIESVNDPPTAGAALNPGERRVLVVCEDSSIGLPITSATRALDLVTAAAKYLSENIDVRSSLLLESCKYLGLERPVRKYEHVLEILNSWDSDTQNEFVIVPASDIYYGVDELDSRSAPLKQPPESTFLMYHSRRSGKWEKRFITLRADGQVISSKKGKSDAATVCHITDFDIYMPTRRQMKNIKASKRFCVAAKSQQKLSYFLNPDNYIHYFCSNDKEEIVAFHSAIHSWRSWYLVNVKGMGSKPQDGTGLQAVTSAETHQLQTGSFRPLIDRNHATVYNNPSSSSSREQSFSTNQTPPEAIIKSANVSRGNANNGQNAPNPGGDDTSEPFAPNSLLGRTYSQRQQRMLKEQGSQKNPEEGPFLSQGLVNSIGANNTQDDWIPPPRTVSSTHSSSCSNTMKEGADNPNTVSNLSRSRSTYQKPKPLVDMGAPHQDLPQHPRRGRGVTVGTGRSLVDAATGPAFNPTTANVAPWSRPTQRSGTISPRTSGSATRQRANTLRSTHQQTQNGIINDNTTPQRATGELPFLPGGLLSINDRVNSSHGHGQTGRGVATGDRNVVGRPMLDLTEPSEFTQGSLLERVERSQNNEAKANGGTLPIRQGR